MKTYQELTERQQQIFIDEFYLHSSIEEEDDCLGACPWSCPWNFCNDFLLSKDIKEASKLYALSVQQEIDEEINNDKYVGA